MRDIGVLMSLVCSLAACSSPVPERAREALSVRLPAICWDSAAVTTESSRFFPSLQLFVGRCSSYFGSPEVAAVAFDAAGVLYLLDGPSSFALVERRHKRPDLDSASILPYAVHAAKLAGQVSWDAELQDSERPSPDPRALSSTFALEGACTPTRAPTQRATAQNWEVTFDVATEWEVARVIVFAPRNGPMLFNVETLCRLMHNP